MTSRALRRLLEKQWRAKGCADPLEPAQWALSTDGWRLIPFDELTDRYDPTHCASCGVEL